VSVSVSTDITQEYREYERTSTTVLDAYIKPIFESYVTDLESDLRDRGIDGRFLITRSGGGALAAANAKSAPVHTILSGPAGGLIGASAVGELLDEPNLIAADMGGTSLDTCVVRDGSPAVAYETSLGHVPVMLPVYDIRTIGAGGGSIAWLDEGLLKVGPESAGADPGPVCYDRGVTAPTVTDAAVTLGYLDPAAFLGGEMELAADSARTAIERELADPLGMDVQSASEGIYEVTRAKTSNALREITVEKGLDPRDFSMVAYGGAGPMFMPLVAREVGVETVIVPQAPALFSAWGMLMAEVVYDFSKTVVRQLDGMSVEELDGQFRDLEAEARETLAGEGIPEENRVFERSVAMRYYGQEHSVVVSADDISSLGDLESAFEMEHESQYGHTMDDPAEVVHLRVRGRGETERPEVRSEDPSEDPSPVGTRDAYCFAKERRTEFAVYERGPLGAGADIDGPAIVREPTTTVVLQSDQAASVTRYGHLLISGGEQS
jgi:N-methylhydantoinase A